jgi:large conductance mechanosensitive channel
MFSEFKAFLMRGNILDLAVGVILGGAFTKVVTSFTGDILMPVIGLILGKVDFSNLFVSFSDEKFATLAEAKKAGAATLNYGLFINGVVDFVIVAFAMYILLKGIAKAAGKTGPVEPPK